jgi:hypothetical protein
MNRGPNAEICLEQGLLFQSCFDGGVHPDVGRDMGYASSLGVGEGLAYASSRHQGPLLVLGYLCFFFNIKSIHIYIYIYKCVPPHMYKEYVN